jgi:4-alpha-glucanotransferase
MNYPSHTDSNWQWRLTIEKMTEMKDYALPKLKELTQIYGREKDIASQKTNIKQI